MTHAPCPYPPPLTLAQDKREILEHWPNAARDYFEARAGHLEFWERFTMHESEHRAFEETMAWMRRRGTR